MKRRSFSLRQLLLSTLLLSGVGYASLAAAEQEASASASPTATAGTASDSTQPLTDNSPTMTAPKKNSPQKIVDEPLVKRVLTAFMQGGAVMWVLLLTSVFGLTFGLERLLSLRRGSHLPARLLAEVNASLRQDGVAATRRMLEGQSASLARVLYGLMLRADATRAELEKIVEDESDRVLWGLRHRIRVVGVVASVAPLLGLLGTVFGLINAFHRAAELGMDNPKNFAQGIYVALYTTAFGLTIAIPFLIFYHYLRGKADVIVREVEELALTFAVESAPLLSELQRQSQAANRGETQPENQRKDA